MIKLKYYNNEIQQYITLKITMPFIHTTPHYTIYFGDSADALHPTMYQQHANPTPDLTASLQTIQNKISATVLFFLRQTHSATGYLINSDLMRTHASFTLQGDFLISQQYNLGIGIMTADCLPVAVYDARNNAIGIAHAGWKGAVQNIATTMLEAMHKNFGTTVNDVAVFFGPSARACCYEVDTTFNTNIANYPWWDLTLHNRNDKIFFDLPLYVQRQLEQYGVPPRAIDRNYNFCTICTPQFYSVRKNKEHAGRNPTVITLAPARI